MSQPPPPNHQLASPNAIPRRTSSTHARSSSLNAIQPSTSSSPPSSRPVLKPVSEATWLGQRATPPPPERSSSRRTNTTKPAPPTSTPTAASTTPHTMPIATPPSAAAAAIGQTSVMPPGKTQLPAYAMNAGFINSFSTPAATPPAPPPPDPNRYADAELDFSPHRSWNPDKERVVRGPYDYSVSHPGKDFRSQLIAAFNVWLKVPAPSLEIITRVVGMLHESSLLVDDVQDSSELRRGFPVAHNIFGVAQTINSANYVYFCAMHELQSLGNPRLLAMFSEELINLHRGQGMDLYWRDALTCPTEEDYLEMVNNKTGGLFRLGVKLMQAESPTDIDCVPLIDLMGLIFQIRDDYMNLSSSEYSDNKGECEDLTEGKFSFPVIHAIRAEPSNLQLINILKQKTNDLQVKRYAVSYMESKGSFDYTRKTLSVLIDRARKTAEDIDNGMGLSQGIQKILDKMVV